MSRAAAAWWVSLALWGCAGDEFTATGGTGGGDATSSSASGASTGTTSSTSSGSSTTGAGGGGGGCPGGCLGDGVCREGTSEEYCGQDGGACDTCEPPAEPCQRAVCDGACGTAPRQDGTPCDGGNGQCQGGACVNTGENCTDGIDNEDDDADVDCADADCSAYACTDPAPAGGWAGPFLVFASDAAIACPAGTTDLGALQTAPTGQCGCSVPAGESCTLTAQFGIDCNTAGVVRELEGGDTAEAACDPTPIGAAGTFALEGSSTEGTCTAEGSVSNAAATFLSTCEILGAGCDAREVCAPPIDPPGGAEVLLCVRGAGSEPSCPAGFSDRRPAWLNPGAPTCDCSCTVEPDTCAGELQTFTDAACAIDCPTCAVVAVPDGAECTTYPGGAGALYGAFVVDDPGEMDPIPGDSVSFPGEPTALYCCQPYPLP